MRPGLVHQEKTEVHQIFMNFVDRVLDFQGKFLLNKFILKCGYGVDNISVIRWISKVLELGVLDLELHIAVDFHHCMFPPEVFVSKSLVNLLVGARSGNLFVEVDGDVLLPKLKTLYLDSVLIRNQNIGLAKLLSGCHVLEALILINMRWQYWPSGSVSNPTIKKLAFYVEDGSQSPNSVTFDTPALVYFEYFDTVAIKYAKVNFDSLVEATLFLRVGYKMPEPIIVFPEGYQDMMELEKEMVGDATDLFVGIRNVQTLYLSGGTVEVLKYCCKAIPIFNNLTHLTIESDPEIGWHSLPGLLKNSPNLETLVLEGLLHKLTGSCGNMCRCKPYDQARHWEVAQEAKDIHKFKADNITSCVLSSPVKVLKISRIVKIDDKREMEQIKHFLESMPHLEQLIIYCDTIIGSNLVKVSEQLQKLCKVASSKCKIQVIPNKRSL